LSAVGAHIRRLVASLLLVPALSFVFHGAAMARLHGADPMDCVAHSSAAHEHHHATHDHSTVHVHEHTHHHSDRASHHAELNLDVAGADNASAKDCACCTSACTVTLMTFVKDAICPPIGLGSMLRLASEDGTDIPPEGPEHPPRTPSRA
jgi:hypothetical protein